MDFFQRLKEMFPNKLDNVLHDVIHYVHEGDGLDDPEEFQLDRMISLLMDGSDFNNSLDSVDDDMLNEASGFIDNPNFTQENQQFTVDDICEKLVDMLPKADPSFLKAEAFKLVNKDASKILEFANQLLDRKDYPTIEDYHKREDNRKLHEKYTTQFKIDVFLKEIPDPFDFFKSQNRTHSLTEKGNVPVDEYVFQVEFAEITLSNHYNKLSRRNVKNYLMHYKNDIIKVCEQLEKIPNHFKDAKINIPLPKGYITNKLLMQELAFVTNKKRIRHFIKIRNDVYLQMYNDAKRNNMFETCLCCSNDELIPEECFFCMSGCIACSDCLKTGSNTRIGDGFLTFPCYASNCKSEYSLPTLKMVLDPIVFYRMEQRKQIDEIRRANLDGFETCPFCDYGNLANPDDKVFVCKNLDCSKESCRGCRHESHIPIKCSEIEYDEDVKLRTQIEDAMTNALVRKCTCGKKIIKESGCNKMTCTCGNTMCYICGVMNINYNHFGTSCSLHSDTEETEAMLRNNVMQGANTAKHQLGIDKNPELLKFDPTKNY